MRTITLTRNGATRTIPTGFSWTTALFGAIPSARRSHWEYFWGVVLVDMCTLVLSITVMHGADFLATFVFGRIWTAWWRNEKLLTDMTADGWLATAISGVPIEIAGRYAANDEEV